MTWFKDWLKTSADKLAANLREAGWPSSSDPVVNPEGTIPESNADATVLTPSVADTVGSSMLGVVPARRNPPVQSNFTNLSNTDRYALDNIITECKHPGIQIVRFPNGETSHHCTLCAKTWGSLAEARVAQREAKDATARRNKAMEDAARAAAAAFDAGIEAENNPVKLDSDRKLKAI